jgi:hypothetical protein
MFAIWHRAVVALAERFAITSTTTHHTTMEVS